MPHARTPAGRCSHGPWRFVEWTKRSAGHWGRSRRWSGRAMGITDVIGGRGEAIAFARLARVCRTDADLPYFWPHYLGEKCEAFDFLVELVDAGEKTPFFFVQVKATRKGYTRTQTPPRLRVEVSERDVCRMVAY